MTETNSPPATWTMQGVAPPQFDGRSQTASVHFCREGGGPLLSGDEREFAQLLQHLRVDMANMPELQQLRAVKDALAALPIEQQVVGCAGFLMWEQAPSSGELSQRTIDFSKRDELVAQLKLASAAAVDRIARRVGLYLHGRSAREIGEAILAKIGPELEELAQRGLASRLLALAGGTSKDLAAKLLDQLVQ